jgi:putative holliday junction resolvase
MSIAALDLGRRRIGVAVTDAAAMGAYPVGVVERRSIARDLEAIAAMLRDREVTTFVIGLPLNMDGSEGPAARSARRFADQLAAALKVEVEMFDERLTSFEARDRMSGLPAKKGARKTGLDALAAVVILEGWMQAHPDKIPHTRS